jgi:UDP-glucuronate 4-epimerase
MSTVLITGAAGFIGYHLAERLLSQGVSVVGLDNLDPYYSVALKQARLDRLSRHSNWRFIHADVVDSAGELFRETAPKQVVHLAAQAGIRHSLQDPQAFVRDNLVGFFSVLEAAKNTGVEHLVYASSSSVYGADPLPFREDARADAPLNLYAATKRSNELMAHAYGSLNGFACTGLRLFTVYGPWGRPDMALFKFTRKILAGETLPVFGHGQMQRDFTYVSDVVEAMLAVLGHPDGVQVYNVGGNQPVGLMELIATLERALGRKAQLEMLPMQPGDAPSTRADAQALFKATGHQPTVGLEEGVARFVAWYRDYYQA